MEAPSPALRSPLSSPLSIGKLVFHEDFLRYLLWVLGIGFLVFLGQAITFFFPSLETFQLVKPVISFFYGVLAIPALSYLTFKWFFCRIQVVFNTSSQVSSVEQKEAEIGVLTFKKGFGNFLVAYFLSFGVLLITFGIGFPYYLYEQKAWFFRESLITFPNGKIAHLRLIPNFKAYFFKSWGLVLLSLVLLIILPILALFLLMGDVIFGGLGFMFGTIGALLLITNYYFYWSIKWLVSHTRLIFPDSSGAIVKDSINPMNLTLFFKNDFFNFMTWSVFFIFLGLVTLGVGLIGYIYWMGRWFINNTEIRSSYS